MITIREVAGKSGFSVTTVSMVLNNGAGVSRIPERTRNRIWEVARRLGYRPNLHARSLRSNRSQTLGVMVFDLTDPYCTQILRGIQNHIRPSGLFPIVTDLQDDRSQFQTCLDMLLGRRVEGIISIANPLYLDSKLLSEFSERNIPAVVIGRELSSVPVSSVVVDNAAGTRLAIEHLYDLGHTKLAFIKGPDILVDSIQRWQGLEGFALEVGLEINPDLIVQIKGRNSTFREAYELTEELLRRRLRFTGLVTFDDLSACAAIRALTKSGRRVPEDCSIVGFDDIPSAAFYNPPLTTIEQQLELQGSLGAEIVEHLMRAAAENLTLPPKHRKVIPKLVVRDSTCPAGKS
ncbi:MAG TPA: LacI family DNA-binding transcriptional regulator [Candidatus Sulfotelmatobacter sp.]|nr:LacI family DNA-binding transcriptional regulator [Candidatus Sulfotelmatobacter sp.]